MDPIVFALNYNAAQAALKDAAANDRVNQDAEVCTDGATCEMRRAAQPEYDVIEAERRERAEYEARHPGTAAKRAERCQIFGKPDVEIADQSQPRNHPDPTCWNAYTIERDSKV